MLAFDPHLMKASRHACACIVVHLGWRRVAAGREKTRLVPVELESDGCFVKTEPESFQHIEQAHGAGADRTPGRPTRSDSIGHVRVEHLAPFRRSRETL